MGDREAADVPTQREADEAAEAARKALREEAQALLAEAISGVEAWARQAAYDAEAQAAAASAGGDSSAAANTSSAAGGAAARRRRRRRV